MDKPRSSGSETASLLSCVLIIDLRENERPVSDDFREIRAFADFVELNVARRC